ncbi:MAG: hypothetical protein ACPGVO_12340, partial [Spirulinaceae cyanobacterium]
MTTASEPRHRKAKGLKRGVPRPAKALCSDCGLCDTHYIAYVKDACAFLHQQMAELEALAHRRSRDLDNEDELYFGVHQEMMAARKIEPIEGAQWTGIVSERVNELKDRPTPEPEFAGGRVEIKLPGALPKPLPPVSTENTLKPDIPEGVRDYEIYGYQQAVTRAGEFARGLGQEMGADLEHMVMEEWHEETI